MEVYFPLKKLLSGTFFCPNVAGSRWRECDAFMESLLMSAAGLLCTARIILALHAAYAGSCVGHPLTKSQS